MSSPSKTFFWLKIKEFWQKYEYKIVLVVAFCLVSGISYEFGVLQGQKWTQKPLIIEKPANTPQDGQTANNEPLNAASSALVSTLPAKGAATTNLAGCAFVGSKSSTKFYVPTCSWAKRIKSENLVCYKNEQEATAKGKVKSDCK